MGGGINGRVAGGGAVAVFPPIRWLAPPVKFFISPSCGAMQPLSTAFLCVVLRP